VTEQAAEAVLVERQREPESPPHPGSDSCRHTTNVGVHGTADRAHGHAARVEPTRRARWTAALAAFRAVRRGPAACSPVPVPLAARVARASARALSPSEDPVGVDGLCDCWSTRSTAVRPPLRCRSQGRPGR
jgi:hypothetical protein